MQESKLRQMVHVHTNSDTQNILCLDWAKKVVPGVIQFYNFLPLVEPNVISDGQTNRLLNAGMSITGVLLLSMPKSTQHSYISTDELKKNIKMTGSRV